MAPVSAFQDILFEYNDIVYRMADSSEPKAGGRYWSMYTGYIKIRYQT